MTSSASPVQELIDFGNAYDYSVQYLVDLNESSPESFDRFVASQPLGAYRRYLSLEAHFTARVVCMQATDCGPCAQLNLRMAVEEGVDREFLRTLIQNPENLPPLAVEVRDHVLGVVEANEMDLDRSQRLRETLGDAAFAELAICIAGSRIYPTLKRAMLHSKACEMLHLDF